MMKIKRNAKGVTLIELLVYMALVSMFMIILVELFTSILKLELTTQSTSSLAGDTRFLVSRMGYDIENAESVSIPSPDRLVFDGANSYSLDANNNLILTEGGVSAKLNSSDTKITDVTFREIAAIGTLSTIQVIFTIESTIVETTGPRSQIIQTTYGLR